MYVRLSGGMHCLLLPFSAAGCRQLDGSGDCPAGQICCKDKDVCDEYNPKAGDADACGKC